MKFIVIGSGVIVHKLVKAFRYAEKIMGNAEIVGVLDVNKEQATEFAKTYDIPNVFTNPEEINVEYDAVYLGVPNFLHYPLAMQYMKMGKHVMSEKPLTETLEKTTELFKVAEENNVQLMEAYMHINHPLYSNEELKPKHIRANYIGFEPAIQNGTAETSPHNFYKRDKFGGAVADVVVYPMALGILMMGNVKGFEIKVKKIRQDVETEVEVKLIHENGTLDAVVTQERLPLDGEEIVLFDGVEVAPSLTFRNLKELRMSHEIMNFVYNKDLDKYKRISIELARALELIRAEAIKQVDVLMNK